MLIGKESANASLLDFCFKADCFGVGEKFFGKNKYPGSSKFSRFVLTGIVFDYSSGKIIGMTDIILVL